MPDSEKATLSTVRNHKRATVILVCFQNVSSSDVLRMKAIITLHPTKYILASCPVNKVSFDQVPITYSVQILQPGTVFFRVFTDPNGHPKLISLSGGYILQLVILSTMFPTGQFSCTLQIMKRSPLNRNVFFLHYTLLSLF